jgi:hypothetical protein
LLQRPKAKRDAEGESSPAIRDEPFILRKKRYGWKSPLRFAHGNASMG